MTTAIIQAIDALKDYKYAWDNTGPGPANNYEVCPLDSLILAINEYDAKALQYLLYHVAARSLPCWESYCESEYPRNTIHTIKQWLEGKTPAWELNGFISAEQPSVNDCRYCDTMAASEAIANAAAFMLDDEPITATASIQSAECAFDNVGMSAGFRNWFFDTAIPLSFEKRFMTEDELSAHTTLTFALEIYLSLYVPIIERPVLEDIVPYFGEPHTVPSSRKKNWWKFC